MAERPRQQPTPLGSSRPSRSPSPSPSSSPYHPGYSAGYSLRTAATSRSRGGPAGLGPCLGNSLGSSLGSPSSRSPSPSCTSSVRAAASSRGSPSGQRLSPEPWNPWAPRPRSSYGTGAHSPTVRGREHARPASPLGSSGGGGSSLGSRPTSPIDLMNPAPYVPEARPSTSHGRLNGRSGAGVGGGIVFGVRRQSAACGPPTSPVAMSNSHANNGSRIQGIQGIQGTAAQQPPPLDGSYGAWGGLSDSPMPDMLDDMPDSLSSSSTPPPQQQPRPQQQQNRETHSPQQSHSQQQNRETQSQQQQQQQQQAQHHQQQSQQRGVANRMSPVMFSTKPSGSTTDLVLETQRRKLLQPLAMGSSGIYEVRPHARVCTTCGMCVLWWCV